MKDIVETITCIVGLLTAIAGAINAIIPTIFSFKVNERNRIIRILRQAYNLGILDHTLKIHLIERYRRLVIYEVYKMRISPEQLDTVFKTKELRSFSAKEIRRMSRYFDYYPDFEVKISWFDYMRIIGASMIILFFMFAAAYFAFELRKDNLSDREIWKMLGLYVFSFCFTLYSFQITILPLINAIKLRKSMIRA